MPLQFLARSYVIGILDEGLVHGQLHIEDSRGNFIFGSLLPNRDPVILVVKNDDMWARIVLSLDMGLSEAYINGDFDISSLKGLFDLWLDNRHTLSGLSTVFSNIIAFMSSIAIRALGRQNLVMALQNVAVAYDTSNEFFQCFLSEEMMYSCALFGDEEHGVRGDLTSEWNEDDLHKAQIRKIHHVLRKVRAAPGTRLLEIGTGWGGMAIEAARLGCTVDTVTLSVPQKSMAEEHAAAAGVSERVRVHLLDYRKLPAAFEGAFDCFVSCEMVEAVGLKEHPTFFKVIDWALKPDKGAAVITATAQPEFRYSEFQADDFARHYHWPNSFLPNATYFAVAAQESVEGRLVLDSVENHAQHYPRTLREWERRFERNFRDKVISSLVVQHPELVDPRNLEAFRRKWIYMFEYAAAGFARGYTALNFWAFARPEYVAEQCD
ncbi:Tuberculostearic acid methyltransferase UfaA1 [Sparassis crispa]|uniref:Tuberculostearic acid methyltransferase UfaA1 n=1 Tax=Sparassis crispa TaxID=139825 RepID=A0A401GXP4_9APHY|nr:Tuberculostearic acid methyltransferase UfaA1 [Sparassis crispa]GBE86996.1 Tuberculostearic acid methyltransferase UfaA1 [Sparassis crispa]